MQRMLTPDKHPSLPQQVEDRIALSREMHNAHVDSLLKIAKPNSLRGSLVGGSIVLACQHHSAIGLLMHFNHMAVAHSVIRPLMEASFRACWLTYAASFQSVQALEDGSATTDLEYLARTLSRKKEYPQIVAFSEAILGIAKIFNSFAHAGHQQMMRRDRGFFFEEIFSGIMLSDVCAVFAVEVGAAYLDSDELRSLARKYLPIILKDYHDRGYGIAPEPGDPALPKPPAWKDPS